MNETISSVYLNDSLNISRVQTLASVAFGEGMSDTRRNLQSIFFYDVVISSVIKKNTIPSEYSKDE